MKRKKLPPIKYVEPTPEEAKRIEKEYEHFRRLTLFFPFPAIPPGSKTKTKETTNE